MPNHTHCIYSKICLCLWIFPSYQYYYHAKPHPLYLQYNLDVLLVIIYHGKPHPLYLQYDLPVLMDIPLVTIYHAEGHGIVGPLGNLPSDLHRLLQGWRHQAQFLGRGTQVSQQQLVLGDALHGLDEIGVDGLSVTELFLGILSEETRGWGGGNEGTITVCSGHR